MRPSPFAVFRNRNFRLMWGGQLISTMGSALTALAASIHVYRVTHSALSVGLMLMATAAPTILIGLIAGVFVDRYDRKRIMIAADLIRAVLVFLIPVLLPLNIAWLYVIVALSSAVGQFFEPAHASVLPEVASDAELVAANSLMAISSIGSTTIGFAASGLIASRFPIEWAFYLDALSFVVSAGFILFIRVAHPEQSAAKSKDERTGVARVARNLRAGLRFLIDTTILRSLFIVVAPIFIIFGLHNTLFLPFALRALGAGEFEFGLQQAAESVGIAAGSLIMARLADRLREGQWLAISYVSMALVAIAYSQSSAVPAAIFLVGLSGFLNAPSYIGRQLIIQRNTPRDMRGRVNSAFFVTRDVMFMIGMALAGLADVVDVRALFFVSSLVLLGAGALVLVMPGLGQPAAEWRRAMSLLRAAPAIPGLSPGRAATLADFDALAALLPSLSRLNAQDREALMGQARVSEASSGATIIRHGDTSDAAYFVLVGRAVAGIATDDSGYRSLSTLNPGDFFGEIAALTGAPRTANVVADEPTTLLQVPARSLRGLMSDPGLSQLFLSKMTERLSRTHLSDLPRLARLDQQSLRELRQAQPEA
ncbi:MAG TPA: MFS transporter [Anaerolineae bacterium]|nr:MFS transporter [Anaerolineae bacterium]